MFTDSMKATMFNMFLQDMNENQQQFIMVIEEMSELTKEISKLIRDKYNQNNMSEEIAHVMYNLEKLVYALNIKDEVDIMLEKTWARANDIYQNPQMYNNYKPRV